MKRIIATSFLAATLTAPVAISASAEITTLGQCYDLVMARCSIGSDCSRAIAYCDALFGDQGDSPDRPGGSPVNPTADMRQQPNLGIDFGEDSDDDENGRGENAQQRQ